MDVPYTARQGQFLAYIHAYTVIHRQAPSESEMADFFGVSPPSAHQMVVTLERRGLIARTPGQARTVRVLLPGTALPDLQTGRAPLSPGPAFADSYPRLAAWIMGGDGWLELGRTDDSRSLVRVLDEGGMVWEGRERYPDLDALLRDAEAGLAREGEQRG